MSRFLHSSPAFFRRIRYAMAAFTGFALLLAAFLRAPLEGAADPGTVPNPVKSAWFLLWIQELVSHSNSLVYPILVLFAGFVLLPRITGRAVREGAAWCLRKPRPEQVAVVLVFLAIVALTAAAAFFRGENWKFVLPF